MFVTDPFDIAPAASRHTGAAWAALAAGVMFALLCAWVLANGLHGFTRARDSTSDARRLVRESTEKEASLRLRQNDPAVLRQLRAQRELQQALRLSWSGLFDALESAGEEVGSRATVVSLTPSRMQADAAEVGITGLAVSDQAMLDFLRALQSQPRVREARLASQQMATQGGVEVIRFQIVLVWSPSGTQHAPGAAR
ncbi:MAG: hypothetical protein JWQ07_116 [Ramlibacter sp.]|nr:hypothetical protein [Ramlibacter sp.]